ncbi:MAG: corrinoid protein [Bacillota bacterium]
MEKEVLFEQIFNTVVDGEVEKAEEMAQKVIELGIDPLEAIDNAFVKGIEQVGMLFQNGEKFLPELVSSAETMKLAMAVLEPELKKQNSSRKTLGKVVLGTMRHDIHDIGKSMIGSMLSAAGFEVIDLGIDVPVEKFVETVKNEQPHVLGLSALLTTTMPEQKYVIEALIEEGLRKKVKVLVGGAPVSQEWADTIGADGFAENAIEAVDVTKKVLGLN